MVIPPSALPECGFATYATHDHDTLAAMWNQYAEAANQEGDEDALHNLRRLAGFCGIPVPAGGVWPSYNPTIQWRLTKALLDAKSRYAALMVTDLFGMTERFNHPGTVGGGNWRLRLPWTIDEIRTELQKLTATSVAIDDRVSRTTVVSPVRGVIKQLKVNTIGGVVQPGSDMLEIVPLDDSLLIEAKVRPQDVAFLHPGQKAMVKFTAYDYTIYGGLRANLELISADTITDEEGNSFYLIQVCTDKSHLGSEEHPLLIIPGMVATVDIITGEKSVLDYLLKPVLKARSEAMRER